MGVGDPLPGNPGPTDGIAQKNVYGFRTFLGLGV